jgi:hypothetical protein
MKTVDRRLARLEVLIRENRFENLEKVGLIRRDGKKPRYELVLDPVQRSLA